MFALEAGDTGPALTHWGQDLRARYPQLRGVVIMSPHWMARGVRVMSNPQPEDLARFWWSSPQLYTLQYPAPGAPALAQEVLGLCSKQVLPQKPTCVAPWITVHGCH